LSLQNYLLFFSLFILFPFTSYGDGGERLVSFVYFYNNSTGDACSFTERGSAVKKNSYQYNGKLDDTGDYCFLKFDKDTFESNFQFCAISGFNNQSNEPGVCSFHEAGGMYYFVSGIVNNKKKHSRICEFVCRTTGKYQGNTKK